MGLIIEELHDRQPELVYFDENYEGEYPKEAPFTISELEEIYPTASKKSKEDEAYKEAAMQAYIKDLSLQDAMAKAQELQKQKEIVLENERRRKAEQERLEQEKAAREKNISIAHAHCGAFRVGAGIPFPFPFPPEFLK